MKLFIKSFIIGIAKIIPGVSGAMLAVNFSIYDKLIDSITNFFDNKKENTKFLLIFGSGILLAISLFSNIVSYFINNYYFITMLFFTSLIFGGTYKFSRNIKYNLKNIIIILLVIILIMFISLFNFDNNYILNGNYLDYVMFFIGGVIEIFSSIVPGISGTALMMLLGVYDNILILFSNIFNISFVLDNFMLYISYGIGMFLSFIIFSLGISFLLKKYRSLFDTFVFGLSISSILLLLIMTVKNGVQFVHLIIGIMLFFIGLVISYIYS